MSETKNVFVTLSDKNYLLNGLALYESLLQYSKSFILHYLCVDNYTYNFFQTKQLPHINHVHISNLYSEEFDKLKQNHKSRPIDTSDGQSPFHWALTPMFVYYILLQEEECLYVDSDILFYANVDDIFQCVENFDVGLITHKHCPLEKHKPNVGYYNVGIIYFRNSKHSLACCKWWRDVVVDTNNPWFHPYGTCGDQKYLELFEDVFPLLKIKIIDEDIGHSAPWNLGPSKLTLENNKWYYDWSSEFILRQPKCKQLLHFHHFSHFTPNFNQGTWSHQRGREWGNCVDAAERKQLYQDYFNMLKNIREKYNVIR